MFVSGRAKTDLEDSFGWKFKIIHNTSNICSCQTVENSQTAFAVNIPFGYHYDVLIPCTRYCDSPTSGLYFKTGVETNTANISQTWYYIEPDSNYMLYAPRVYVAPHKLNAYLQLCNNYDEDLLIYLEVLFNDYNIPFCIENLKNNVETIYHKSITTYFRDTETYFEDGCFDCIDDYIQPLVSLHNIDVMIFTHQTGSYKKLVSECVDCRTRETSFNNIYKVN